jgi:zona occludens toxin (predicted ATPase)
MINKSKYRRKNETTSSTSVFIFFNLQSNKHSYKLALLLLTIMTSAYLFYPHPTTAENNQTISKLIEEALFTRTEFFGSQAIVPYSTSEAKSRLSVLLNKYPFPIFS